MEMIRSSYDEIEARLVGFAHWRRSTRDRIAQLKELSEAAKEQGGILTMSLEALQDEILNIRVGPDVLTPYLAAELEQQEAQLKKMDAKAKQLLEIINY
jgi:hypothetical protein